MKKNIAILVSLLLTSTLFGQTRNNDPVVVKGVNLPCMLGVQPSRIVAYKFNGTNLVQIPVQVDEVVVKEASAPYNNLGCAFGTVSNNNTYDNISFYADANTFTGADTNLLFDSDDEVVFMAKDAGSKLTVCPPTPSGVINNTTCELELRDPLNNTVLGYVYLFQQNGTLNQSAGVTYVTYNFTYATNYKTAYDICAGGVTENSTVTTANYSMKYSKRAIEDELRITAGGASSVDILDRHQFFVAPNNCFRSEDTFSDSRGTVVTSKNGPVRAIRSVMGANSGVGTQMTKKFTESRVDYQLDFRVHPIGGFHDVLDLNPNAIGMMYYNNQNPNGVVIDGVQDVLVTTNPNIWELYTGNQGSIAVGFDYQTDIPLGVNSVVRAYYDDGGSTNPKHICTGDGFAYGASGFNLVTGLCTDYWATASGCGSLASYFRLNRRNYMLPPATTPAQASTYASYGTNPVTTTQVVASLTSFCTSSNYTVTTSSNPTAGGTTTGGGSYASGSSVTVTATANSGYTFTNWTENGNQVSTNASYTFTVSANRNLVANFSQNTTNFSITTSSNPTAGGTTTGSGSYASGSSVTVTATANSGYAFTNWTENGNQVSTNASYTFTVSANRNLVANFTQKTTTYTVTTSSNPVAGGTTSGGGSFANGASVTVTATSNAGYTFSNWTENSSVVSSSANYTFTVSANRNLVANFTATATVKFVVSDVTANRAYYYDANFGFVTSNRLSTTVLNGTTNASDVFMTATNGYILDGVVSGRVYRSSQSNTATVGSRTLRTTSGSALNPATGLIVRGDTLYLLDKKGKFIYYYSLSQAFNGATTTLNAFSRRALLTSNSNAEALGFDGTYFYVLDNSSTKAIFRYSILGTATGVRSRPMRTNTGVNLGTVTGLVVDGNTVRVSDRGTDRAYSFDMGQLFTGSNTVNLNATSFNALNSGNLNATGISITGTTSLLREFPESEVKNGLKILAWPNPTAGAINVTLEGLDVDRNFVIQAFDMTGRLIAKREESGTSTELIPAFDLTGLDSGVYLIVINQGESMKTVRVMLQ